ncbi:hypothetical protein GCM10023195_01140 [Actinoallomurus liliacearum]|uniref:Uncharacterized protein n=2 Tax=Actinoallomurus liliacearum TaxID=1080073 RepID=A0ABP8T8L6_9ACTN
MAASTARRLEGIRSPSVWSNGAREWRGSHTLAKWKGPVEPAAQGPAEAGPAIAAAVDTIAAPPTTQ